MKTSYFAVAPAKIKGEKTIATADNGRVYTEQNELHIETDTRHYIYKHAADPVGWYEENVETGGVFFLGEGASPTAQLDNVAIEDAEAWAAISSPADEIKRGKRVEG